MHLHSVTTWMKPAMNAHWRRGNNNSNDMFLMATCCGTSSGADDCAGAGCPADTAGRQSPDTAGITLHKCHIQEEEKNNEQHYSTDNKRACSPSDEE